MRICSIVDATNPHTRRWVNYFAQQGHEVHLISWLNGNGFEKDVRFHYLPRLMPAAWALTKYPSHLLWPLWVRHFIREIQPDIIDGQGVTIRGYLAAFSGFHPAVVIGWGSDVLIHPQNPFWRMLTRRALQQADVVMCSSALLERELVRLGTAPDKIHVVSNGVDTGLFSPRRRDEGLRKRLGLGEAPTIISIRNLRPLYDVETFIRAMPIVLAKFPEARFIIGGEGEQRRYLENLARSLRVEKHVIFTGWIPHEEVPKYLASSDIYVSTALSDTLQVSLLEARACGLAPVVTDLPALRDVVQDGADGFLIPVKGPDELAERIIRLLRDDGLRRHFGELGRKLVMEAAEYKKEMEKAVQLYQETVVKYTVYIRNGD
jgi:glycosyltransferase involved in cell wall biosynthesis